MPTYTVELTDVEQKSMEYISTDVDFWIQNAVHERARLAGDELVAAEIKFLLENNQPIPPSRDEIIMGSTLPNAQERSDANTSAMNKMMETGR